MTDSSTSPVPVTKIGYGLDEVLAGINSLDPNLIEDGAMAADLAGGIKRLEDALAAKRVEVTDWATDEGNTFPRGEGYEFYESPTTKNEWTDEDLLILIGGDQVSGLQEALTEGLVKLSWQWSKVQQYAATRGLALLVKVIKPGASPVSFGDRTPHVIRTTKVSSKVRPRSDIEA